jgi:hypothetical protein
MGSCWEKRKTRVTPVKKVDQEKKRPPIASGTAGVMQGRGKYRGTSHSSRPERKREREFTEKKKKKKRKKGKGTRNDERSKAAFD